MYLKSNVAAILDALLQATNTTMVATIGTQQATYLEVNAVTAWRHATAH
jgi:hypothetical protein